MFPLDPSTVFLKACGSLLDYRVSAWFSWFPTIQTWNWVSLPTTLFVFSLSHFLILMEDPIISSTFIAQYSTRLHLIRYRNVCSQIHRVGWEGRGPILLLFHWIRWKSQRGSPCTLAHWWPWLLCYIWACHWDRLPFHYICFVLSFLLLLGFLKLWFEAAIRMSHVIFSSYITEENYLFINLHRTFICSLTLQFLIQWTSIYAHIVVFT